RRERALPGGDDPRRAPSLSCRRKRAWPSPAGHPPRGGRQSAHDAIRQAIASGTPAITVYAPDTPTGHRHFERRLQAIEGEGAPRTVVLIVQDVTRRILLEQERRIAAIAVESQQGMMVTDARTRILRVNKTFTEVTGYASEDVIGKPARMLAS